MVSTREYEILREIDQRIWELQGMVALHRQETRYDRENIMARIARLEAKASKAVRGPLIDLKQLGPLWIPLVTLAGLLAANVPLKEAVLTAFK
jgi:hypothetical protein